jgi:hypothetical protein
MDDDPTGYTSPEREATERTSDRHSSEYVKRAFAEIASAQPDGLSRCVKILAGRLIHIVVETSDQDEEFYLVPDDTQVRVSTADQRNVPAVSIRLTPEVISDILQGELTPVEAFFMGKLRARGTTPSLYAFLEFFIGVAQLGVTVPSTIDLIVDFEETKRAVGSRLR